MDGTFVDALATRLKQPRVETVNGQECLLVPNDWKDATPKEPTAPPLLFASLSGFCEYVNSDADNRAGGARMIHIASHDEVRFVGQITSLQEQHGRPWWASAGIPASPFKFSQWMSAEEFMIGLQSHFVEDATRNALVALAGSIRDSEVRDVVDDTLSQEVKTARGIHLVGAEKVPNPVTLRPWRTFREVEQPASQFVLRLRPAPAGGTPTFALFEADGGAWKLEAMSAIAKYLSDALEGAVVLA